MRRHSRVRPRSERTDYRTGDIQYAMPGQPNWPGNEFHRDDWTPDMKVEESKNQVTVTAELPGIDPGDIDITVQNNVLTISGPSKHGPVDYDEDYFHVRHEYGRFSGTVELSGWVDPDSVKADFHDGMLTIELHKIDRSTPRHVSVKT